MSGDLLPSQYATDICGVSVPPYIIGDAAYPLKTWLMKPFPGRGLSEDRRNYNYRISRARMVVENAFGRLKGRWRRLLKRCDMTLDKVPTMIAACCILHNICEVFKDNVDEQWRVDNEDLTSQHVQDDDEAESSQPHTIRLALMNHFNM